MSVKNSDDLLRLPGSNFVVHSCTLALCDLSIISVETLTDCSCNWILHFMHKQLQFHKLKLFSRHWLLLRCLCLHLAFLSFPFACWVFFDNAQIVFFVSLLLCCYFIVIFRLLFVCFAYRILLRWCVVVYAVLQLHYGCAKKKVASWRILLIFRQLYRDMT